MKKFNVVAASAVALSAALASGSAFAHGTLAVTTATYNAASVTSNSGQVTVPWGTIASAVYTVTNGTTTTSLEVNSRFTVTLPTGFTFGSAPSLTTGGGTQSTALSSGGIGFQSATFTIGSPAPGNAPINSGQTLALNQVEVIGIPLETPGNTFPITVQATANAQTLNNDAGPVFATNPAFASDTGVTATFASPAPASLASIQLASPTLGTAFTSTGGGLSTTADLGTVTLAQSGSLAFTGSTAIVSTSDTASLTIAGFFNGIKTAYSTVAAGPGSCGGTVASVGTATGNSITIPAAPVIGGAEICITATGTTLLSQNGTFNTPANFTAVYTPGASVTDFLGGSARNTTEAVTYTGGQTIPVTTFLTGTDAGYASLVRVNSTANLTNTLFAVAQPYTGGPSLVGSLGTLAAGAGTVFSEAAVGTATGLALANSGQRATLTLIATPGGVQASGLLVNPGGVVDNVN